MLAAAAKHGRLPELVVRMRETPQAVDWRQKGVGFVRVLVFDRATGETE